MSAWRSARASSPSSPPTGSGSRCASSPGSRTRPLRRGRRARPGPHARRRGQDARLVRRQGRAVARGERRAARPVRLRPAHHDPAARRGVPAVPPAAADRALGRGDHRGRRRSSRRSSACRSSPSAAPRSASSSSTTACACPPVATTRVRAEEELPVEYTGDPVTIAFNPGYLLDGLGAVRTQKVPPLVHHAEPPGVAQAGGRGWQRGAGLPVPADARPPARLRNPSGYQKNVGENTVQLGLVGLGKMGFNMRERVRAAGHEVIGYDRNPEVTDSESLADMVSKLEAPRVVWVMVPAGEITRQHGHGARRAARRRRPRDRRRQLPVHRRQDPRGAAGGEGDRLPRLRCVRRRVGPRQRLRPDGRRRRRSTSSRRCRSSTRCVRRVRARRASRTRARSAPVTTRRWCTTASSTA